MTVELGSAAGKIEIDVSGVTAGINAAQKSLQGATSSLESVGGKISSIGTTMSMAITAPVVGAGIASIKLATDYESSMNVLQSVTGATTAQMAALDKEAIALGNDLKLPATSAFDAGGAMTELGKAGLNVDQVLKATRGTLQLAIAGQLGEAEAARITANMLNAFSLEGEQATKIANMLAAGANASSAEVKGLADASQMASAVFASAKFTASDMITSIALMSNAGIQGSDAGTSLKQAILALEAPSKAAGKVMSEYGISIYNVDGSMKSWRDTIAALEKGLGPTATKMIQVGGATKEMQKAALSAKSKIGPLTTDITLQGEKLGILQQELAKTATKFGASSIEAQKKALAVKTLSASIAENKDKLKTYNNAIGEYQAAVAGSKRVTVEITDAMRNKALADIFGSDAVRAANILLKEGTAGFDEMTKAINRAGAADDLAGARMKGMNGALEAMKSQLETVGLVTARAFLPALQKIVERVSKLIEAFGNLPESTRTAIVSFSLLAAAIGPVLLTVGMLIKTIGTIATLVPAIGTAVTAIGAALAPVIVPILAVVAAVALLYLAFKNNFLGIRDFVEVVFARVKEIVGAVVAWLNGDISFDQMAAKVKTAFSGLTETLSRTWQTIKTKASELWGAIGPVITEKIEGIRASAAEKWESLRANAGEKWDAVYAKVSTVVGNIKTFVVNTLGEVVKAAADLFGLVLDAISGRAAGERMGGGAALSALLNVVQLRATIVEIVTAVDGLRTQVGTIMALVPPMFAATWLAVQMNATLAWAGLRMIITTASTLIEGDLSRWETALQTDMAWAWAQMLNNTRVQFEAMRAAAVAATRALHDQVMGILNGMIGEARSSGEAIGNAVADGIRASIGAAVAAAEELAAAVAAVLPHSDAERGPLSHLTDSGRSLPATFGAGILANVGAAVSAASRMAGQVAGMLLPGTGVGMTLAYAGAGGGGAFGTVPQAARAGATVTVNVARVGDEVDVEALAYRVAEVLQWRAR